MRERIILSNRTLYTFITLGVLVLLGIGVYAYGTNNPQIFGHSIDELAAPLGCTSGEFLQWSGSQWTCATVNVSADPGFDLVNGQHSSSQCTDLGGTVVDDGTGILMCRLSGASCPTGWARYNYWGTTQATTCTGAGGTCACTTSGHYWADNANVETCTFYRSLGKSGCFNPETCTATKTEIGCY